ncbi:MAG: acyl-CoA dehydrogenase C-terminal domain-containing protein, partial [Allosphingosinicella sp.]
AKTQGARAISYLVAEALDRSHRETDEAGRKVAAERAAILTPVAKAYATDIGIDVASTGVQVHGGMGFVEETGAAQQYRDIRIAPIYEGTNGIQAADLVGRKLGLEGGETLRRLLGEIRAEADGPLLELTAVVENVVRRLTAMGPEDRLAGSYPFLTLLSTLVCGWLMKRQLSAVESDGIAENHHFETTKRAACLYYLEHVVPEAAGLAAQATAGAGLLYPGEELFPG